MASDQPVFLSIYFYFKDDRAILSYIINLLMIHRCKLNFKIFLNILNPANYMKFNLHALYRDMHALLYIHMRYRITRILGETEFFNV